jgi:hypothetical protein
MHVIAFCAAWLRSSGCLFFPGFDVIRWDRPGEHGGGVMLGFKRDLEFEKVQSAQISSCVLIAASVEEVNGQKLSIVPAYCRIGSEEVGEAHRELRTPP